MKWDENVSTNDTNPSLSAAEASSRSGDSGATLGAGRLAASWAPFLLVQVHCKLWPILWVISRTSAYGMGTIFNPEKVPLTSLADSDGRKRLSNGASIG